MFYAAQNYMSSESSTGFANTWEVLAFQKKEDRDVYVRNSPRIGTRAIKAREVAEFTSNKRKGGKYIIDSYTEVPEMGIVGRVTHDRPCNIDGKVIR